jgi:hypothetical protein
MSAMTVVAFPRRQRRRQIAPAHLHEAEQCGCAAIYNVADKPTETIVAVRDHELCKEKPRDAAED